MSRQPRPSAPDVTGPGDVIAVFDSPPVAEVVAAVRFAEISDATFMAVGDLWREQFSGFPTFELRPPYEVPVETFGSEALQSPSPDFRLLEQPPLSRVWLTDDSGQELIQIQNDWLAANWRKVHPTNRYGQWPARRAAFADTFTKFEGWAGERGSIIAPTQCEVTYINHIVPSVEVWSDHSDSHRLFRGLLAIGGSPHPLEQITWQAKYLIESPDGGPQGRLHASAQPAFRVSDSTPMVILELTARLAPEGPSLSQVLDALDAGRAAIVKTFISITSDEAQKAWGMK